MMMMMKVCWADEASPGGRQAPRSQPTPSLPLPFLIEEEEDGDDGDGDQKDGDDIGEEDGCSETILLIINSSIPNQHNHCQKQIKGVYYKQAIIFV